MKQTNLEPTGTRSVSTTVRVVAAVLFMLGVVLFFQHTPNALRWPVRVLWLASIVWLMVVTIRTVRVTKFTRIKIAFLIVLGGFYYLVLSLICHVFLKLMSQRDERLATRGMTTLTPECRAGIQAVIDGNKFSQFSPEIGWVLRANSKTRGSTINSQGLRGKREYSKDSATPEKRVLCVGNSFTFGTAVGDDETYAAQAEKLKPGTEWLNFGCPATCLTQSYLRYMHDTRNYAGKNVVIGFMTNDAQRTVNVFRPFVNAESGCPLTKPFAKYEDRKFTIEPNPYQDVSDLKRLLADEDNELKKLLKLDYLTWSKQRSGDSGPISRTLLYVWDSMSIDRNMDALLPAQFPLSRVVKSLAPLDPYGRDIWKTTSPGFKAICTLFDTFHQQVMADGRKPLIVIFPGPLDLANYKEKNPRQYATLVDYFHLKNYACYDFLDTLVTKHKNDLSENAIFVESHYRPTVNREVAEEINKALHLP